MSSTTIQFSLVTADNGQQFVTVFADGVVTPPAGDDHPNFKAIVGACEAAARGEDVDAAQVVGLFDVAQTITEGFQRLTERVSVENGVVLLDGDPVHGALQDQIVDFVAQGEDFGPLVSFYEKLVTNPLGDVREGVYGWITGQTKDGAGGVTITPDGDLIGYKSCQSKVREDGTTVYRPSRPSKDADRVNGVPVEPGQYIEQQPGDTVEMPRSKVLHAPSQACGDGLHIGTWSYASGFQGDTVLLVKFSPRDIVSLPDWAATWKLRVCRYTVIGPCEGPLDTPLYITDEADVPEALDLILDAPLVEGDRVVDEDGDEGTVVHSGTAASGLAVQYDDSDYGTPDLHKANVTDDGAAVSRTHGKGGPTSQVAKGRGRNPAQDASGRFSQGRPGSKRDGSTGRFAA